MQSRTASHGSAASTCSSTTRACSSAARSTRSHSTNGAACSTTNLTSAFLVARAVVPQMIERGRGKIVNTCSATSELGRETIGPYTASKGGLRQLTRAMCADWARHGIQANGIGPGYFRTEMNRDLQESPEFVAWLEQRVPARRWGDPSELGGAVVFLASPASDFVNGQILYVDGGLLAVL